MKLITAIFCKIVILTVLTFIYLPASVAHMMLAQHGTLNVVDDGVFMVLSLPVSAFEGIDDNSDGKLSKQEFDHHRLAIANNIIEKVTLSDAYGKRPLKGLLLTLASSHDHPNAPVDQLNITGKFMLDTGDSVLSFHLELFGKKLTEQLFEITATRKIDNQKQVLEIIPTHSNVTLFMN